VTDYPPPNLDGAQVLAASRAAVWRYARRFAAAGYGDDLAAQVALLICERAAVGYRCGWRFYRIAVFAAIRSIFGDVRYHPTWMDNLLVPDLGTRDGGELDNALFAGEWADPSTSGPAALTMTRLQALWPTLTDIQQAWLRCWLTGESAKDAAVELGTSNRAICNAGPRVLERLDNPRAFSRVAKRRKETGA